MRYRILVRSNYEYTARVRFARHAFRLLPHDTPAQRVLAAELQVEPTPYQRDEVRDYFGNRVVQVVLEKPHSRLAIRMDAEVEVLGAAPADPDRSPPWEAVREAAIASSDFGPLAPAHYLHPGSQTGASDEVVAFAREHLPPGRPLLRGAFDLACAIHRDFDYAPGETDVETPAVQGWQLRRGVCQDFSHIMLAALRSLGLPAAYVSGLLCTRPPPGKERLEGADAMHAWVSVWLGAEMGWQDIDPTNAVLVGEDHIRIAVGREYADVAPIDGVIVAAGDQSHDVAVDVVPLRAPADTL
ncbi:MAG TPA: transglutaminase family protein [Lautropia sp.]|nr:transglutaminase family protein [Lautropia sp.]